MKKGKGVGRPAIPEGELSVRKLFTLPRTLSDWLDRQRKGSKSKIVQNSLQMYKAVLDGKAKFVAQDGYEEEIDEILRG